MNVTGVNQSQGYYELQSKKVESTGKNTPSTLADDSVSISPEARLQIGTNPLDPQSSDSKPIGTDPLDPKPPGGGKE